MIKHKWLNDECLCCGIKREKRERKMLSHTFSALGRDGIFNDVPVYNFHIHYAYSYNGLKWSFDRPDCSSPELNYSPAPGTK